MKVAIAFLILPSLLFVGCGSSRNTAQPALPLLIGDFDGRSGVDTGMAQIIRDAFTAELQKTKRFIVVDRKSTAAIMQEQQFQASQGERSPASPKLHSLRKLISGSIGKLGEDFVFNIKMTDMETATVDFAIAKTYNGDLEDVIEDFLPQLAREVVQSLEKR